MVEKNGKLRNQADIARKFNVSRETVKEWARRDDWPGGKAGGVYDVEAIDAYLRANNLGPYRAKYGTITQARQAYLESRLIEQESKNVLIELEATQAVGDVVLMADVEAFYVRTVSVATMILGELVDRIERELPAQVEGCPNWVALRQRILSAAERVSTDSRSCILELLSEGESDASELE